MLIKWKTIFESLFNFIAHRKMYLRRHSNLFVCIINQIKIV